MNYRSGCKPGGPPPESGSLREASVARRIGHPRQPCRWPAPAQEHAMSLPRSLAVAAMLAAAALVPSALAQQAQVYQLPAGAYPHDVAPAPDGKVWYSAQKHGAIGIFDP